MRIINSVLGDARGGRWRVVCDYSRVLRDRGHQVSLLLGHRHAPDPASIPAHVEVAYVRSHGHYDYLAAWRLKSKMRAAPPDVVIAHCSRSVALFKQAFGDRVPIVAVSHSPKVRRLLPASAYIALTADIQQRFAKEGASRPCFIVPNLIEIDSRRIPAERPYHDPVRVGALGRFDPVKGFDVFIDALGKLKQSGRRFEAILGGSGVEQARLMAHAADMGLGGRLSFPGWIEDVETFLAGIDILCVPARSDAFGLTPLQAARAGTAMVLSTASGHCAMFEAERQALFAGIDNASQMARQIVRLMDDRELGARLRQAAFERVVADYSEAVVTEKLVKIIENIVKYGRLYY